MVTLKDLKQVVGDFSIITKIAIGTFLAAFLFIVIVLLISAPSRSKISDRDAFLSFYRQTMAACKPIDDTFKPFAEAAGKQRWMDAAVVAKRIKDPMNDLWYNFTLIKIPDLQNVEAKKLVEKGKESLDISYLHKKKIIDKYIELIQGKATLADAGSDFINSGERVQQLTTSGLLSFYMAGEKLGVSPAEMKL